mgnify:CR=1 FL=1
MTKRVLPGPQKCCSFQNEKQQDKIMIARFTSICSGNKNKKISERRHNVINITNQPFFCYMQKRRKCRHIRCIHRAQMFTHTLHYILHCISDDKRLVTETCSISTVTESGENT